MVVALTVLTSCGGGGRPPEARPSRSAGVGQDTNPYAGRAGYADPTSRTARAAARAAQGGSAEQARVLDRLAHVPQGIWLTPEEHPAGEVGRFVARTVAAADRAGQVPTFVVYGIPDRDCSGGYSGGGLPAAEYGPWVQQVADAAARAADAVAIVEPDSLASALECGDRAERLRLVRDAVDRLVAARVATYVDGGHSHWVDAKRLAPLLLAAGVERARGFATNVSNFQSDQDERAYAERLSALVGGAHYVIDTGRNGFGSTRAWCNPPGRAFGTDPGAVEGGGRLDAYLWIKPPGESDGTCGGGPPAGVLWPERVQELADASGW